MQATMNWFLHNSHHHQTMQPTLGERTFVDVLECRTELGCPYTITLFPTHWAAYSKSRYVSGRRIASESEYSSGSYWTELWVAYVDRLPLFLVRTMAYCQTSDSDGEHYWWHRRVFPFFIGTGGMNTGTAAHTDHSKTMHKSSFDRFLWSTLYGMMDRECRVRVHGVHNTQSQLSNSTFGRLDGPIQAKHSTNHILLIIELASWIWYHFIVGHNLV